MADIKNKLLNIASTPQTSLKRLVVGTLLAAACMIALLLTSALEMAWLFYLLSSLLVLSVIYAIPGYLGIWIWRMRHLLGDSAIPKKTDQ